MDVGSLMLLSDHINFAGANPLIGDASGNDRFVDMGGAYDEDLRTLFVQTAGALGIELHQGVYIWLSGPSFETHAEIRMAQVLGADAVGMSTVPEVILARQAGLRVAAISNITNLGAGLSDDGALSHEHTIENAAKGAVSLEKLIVGVLERL